MKRLIEKMVIAMVWLATATACGNGDGTEVVGFFEATEVTVSNEIAGRLVKFAIDEGDSISKGEQVGIVDTVQLYLTKLQLMKSAKSIRSNRPEISKQIASLEVQIDKQKHEKARIERLIAANAATDKQLDDINAEIRVLESNLDALQSTLNNNLNSLEEQGSAVDVQVAQVDDKLARCHIISPIGGTILAKYAEEGEFAAVGQPLFKIADIQHLFLRVYVTSKHLANVQLGQKITVVSDIDGRTYEGTVAWIADKAEFTPKNIQAGDDRQNLVYAVKIKVINDGWLKIGMYGKIIL